jgi:hypothetical protein
MSGFLTKQRDYRLISQIELDFFSSLSSCAHHFKGAESPGDWSHTVAAALANAITFLNSGGNDPLNVIVCFDVSDCRPRNQGHFDRMYLGTKLVPSLIAKERQVTHFLALAKAASCEVKIHFDLDFDVDADERKPSPHLQIGGRALKTRNTELDVTWNGGLDKPRLPCLPYCTALLWHAAFLEFQECTSVGRFVGQNWWRNLVKKAETALWQPFCDDLRLAMNKGSAIEAFHPPSVE